MPTPRLSSLRHRLPAAAFRMRRIAANARTDLKYGSLLALDRQSASGVFNVRNSDYAALDEIFGGLVEPDDVLVDVGCSTGRVINFWLDQGLRNRIIGLEMNGASASRAQKRLQGRVNVEIVNGDAVDVLPNEGTIFYVYNPFGPAVMEAFRACGGVVSEARPPGHLVLQLQVSRDL